MVNKTLSFLLGVFISSAWWQAGVFRYGKDDTLGWTIAVIATVLSLGVIAFNFNIEWHRERKWTTP